MASGSFVKYIDSKKTFYIKVWWSSKQIDGENQSEVIIYSKLYRKNRIYDTNTDAHTVSLSVDGNKIKKATKSTWSGSGWTKEIIRATTTVPHSSTGKGSVKIKVEADLNIEYDGKTYSSVSTGDNLCNLDTLALKSTLTINNSTETIGNTIIFTINKNLASLKHYLTLYFDKHNGGTGGYINLLSKEEDDSTKTSFSVSYKLNPDICLAFMKNKKVKVRAELVTYTSASSSVPIGQYSGYFYLNVRDTDSPTLSLDKVSFTPIPIEPNNDSTAFIEGRTNVSLNITPSAIAAGGYGEINYYEVIFNGDYKLFAPSLFPITLSSLVKSGKNTLMIRARDERMMWSNQIVATIDGLPYFQPIISDYTAVRCSTDGTEDNSGTYVKLSGLINYPDCNGKNVIDLTLWGKSSTDTSYSQIGDVISLSGSKYSFEKIVGTYSTSETYEFKIIATDIYDMSATTYTEITTETLLVDVTDTGIAFGRVSSRENAFECQWPAYFSSTVYSNNNALTSDERCKNILSNEGLDKLINVWTDLQLSMFTYKSENDKIQIGLIAQDVIKIFEKYKLNWSDYGAVYYDETTDMYSINYEFFNQLTLYVAKALKSQISDLEKRISLLENK